MTYPITGIRAGLGPGAQVPVRREIDEWYASTDPNDQLQVSLFIMGLLNFQELDPQGTLSYFQVAGILPFLSGADST
jgi:tyrosinase